MGKHKGPYNAEYPVGSQVSVIDLEALKRFKEYWKWHDPVTEEMLQYAGKSATVKSVGYYHGGDELYTLDVIPGIWHEACLVLA
jgi:hypothetical protein